MNSDLLNSQNKVIDLTTSSDLLTSKNEGLLKRVNDTEQEIVIFQKSKKELDNKIKSKL